MLFKLVYISKLGVDMHGRFKMVPEGHPVDDVAIECGNGDLW